MILLLTAWLANGADLVLAGPDLLPDLQQSLPASLALEADAQIVPVRQLALPTSTAAWVATGAETRLCMGARQPQQLVVSTVVHGRAAMDYGEDVKARAAFRDAEAILPCADDRVEASTLWDLYFFAGVLAAQNSDEAESIRLFRAAALAQPDGTWDEQYAPEVQRIYMRGRAAASAATHVTLELRDPARRFTSTYLDGRNVDLGSGPVSISADRHLLQLRSSLGDFLSMQLRVSGDVPVLIVTREGLLPLLLDAGSPTEISAANQLLSDMAEHTQAQRIIIVNTEQRSTQVWQGGALQPGPALKDSAPPPPNLTSTLAPSPAPPKVPTPQARQPGSGAWSARPSLLIYADAKDDVKDAFAAVAFSFDARVWRGFTLDAGVILAFQSAHIPSSDGGETSLSLFLPVGRLGAAWSFGDGRTRPRLGVAALQLVHERRAPTGAVIAVVGLRHHTRHRLHYDLEAGAGGGRVTIAQLGAGIGSSF